MATMRCRYSLRVEHGLGARAGEAHQTRMELRLHIYRLPADFQHQHRIYTLSAIAATPPATFFHFMLFSPTFTINGHFYANASLTRMPLSGAMPTVSKHLKWSMSPMKVARYASLIRRHRHAVSPPVKFHLHRAVACIREARTCTMFHAQKLVHTICYMRDS